MQQPSHWRPCFYPGATSLRCPGYCKTRALLWTAHIFWCNPPPVNSSFQQSFIHISQSLFCAGLRVQHCCLKGAGAGAESWLDATFGGYSSWLSLGPPCHSTVSNLKTESKSAASRRQMKQSVSSLLATYWCLCCRDTTGSDFATSEMFSLWYSCTARCCTVKLIYPNLISVFEKKNVHVIVSIDYSQEILDRPSLTQTGWEDVLWISSCYFFPIKLTICHVLFGQ